MSRLLVFCFCLCGATASVAQSTPEAPIEIESPSVPDDLGGSPDEPEVTIIHRGEEKHEEYRVNGRLYMVKVTPSHGVPYYLVDRRGSGQFARFDTLDPGFTVPMWVIRSF